MNKTIAIIIVIAIGLVGLMFAGRPGAGPADSSQASAVSVLTASEKVFDFGSISMTNGLVEHRFTVTNPTDKDITVEDITTSCMCTAAFIVDGDRRQGPFGMPGMGYVPKANMIVKAGGSQQIDVVYDPNAHGPAGVGVIDRFVYLRSKEAGTLQLEVRAVVTP